MEKKKVLLRLYNPHDIDLISLMVRHQMDIIKAVYCAVTAFANKESFVIRIPPLRECTLESKRVYSKHLTLDLEKDQTVIQLLDRIEPGYRNNFLKNILRLYLIYPATETFFIDSENLELFETHYQTLMQGKRCVDAAVLKDTKRHIARKPGQPEELPLKKETPVPAAVIVPDAEPIMESISSTSADKDSFSTLETPIISSFTEDIVESIPESILESIPEHMEESSIDETQENELTDLFTALLG